MTLHYTRSTDSVEPLEFKVDDCNGERDTAELAREVGDQLEKMGYDQQKPVYNQEGNPEAAARFEVFSYNPFSEAIKGLTNILLDTPELEGLKSRPTGVGGYAETPEEMIDNLENGGLYLKVIGYSDDEDMPRHAEEEIPFRTELVNREENLEALQTVDDAIQDSPYDLVGYGAVGNTGRFDNAEQALEEINEGQFRVSAQVDTPLSMPAYLGFMQGDGQNEFGVGIRVPSRWREDEISFSRGYEDEMNPLSHREKDTQEQRQRVARDLEEALENNVIQLE